MLKIVRKVDLTSETPIEFGALREEISLDRILFAVCDANNISIQAVINKGRQKETITAVREYCYLAWLLTTPVNTLETIASEIGRTHAMVLYHKNKIIDWINIKSYNLADKLKTIENNLTG